MDLTTARAWVAEALSSTDYEVRARPGKATAYPKAGDGWVTVSRIWPGDFPRRCWVTLAVVLVLGADEAAAEERIETGAPGWLEALTAPDDDDPPPLGDVAVEPVTLLAGDPSGAGAMYGATVTLTLECETWPT